MFPRPSPSAVIFLNQNSFVRYFCPYIKFLLDGKIVKITDFNVSKFIENKKKKFSFLSTENYKMWTYTGTIAFTAPEVFNDSEYTEAIDMWSAGVVLYTMLCGFQPFQAE